MDHSKILGTVLAGGKSVRLGMDKSQVKLADKLLIDYILSEIIEEFKKSIDPSVLKNTFQQIPGKNLKGRRLYSLEQVEFLIDAVDQFQISNPAKANWDGFRKHIKQKWPN